MSSKKTTFISACFGMLVFGIVLTILGTILPILLEKFNLSTLNAGSLISIMNAGILVGTLIFGPTVDRFGYKFILILSILLIAIGLFAISTALTITLLKIALFTTGLGGGIINGGTNSLTSDISETDKTAKLSLLGIFFGIGAFGIPLLFSSLLRFLEPDTIIKITSIITLMPLFLFIFTWFPSSKQTDKDKLFQNLKKLRNPLLIFLSILLFFESGIEISTGNWASTFLYKVIKVEKSQGIFSLSLFWLGMMSGRLLLSKILTVARESTLFIIYMLIALISSIAFISSSNYFLTSTLIFFMGFGYSSTYPIVLSTIGNNFREISATAFSLALSIALVGGITIPYLIGLVTKTFNFRVAFVLIPLSIVIIIAIFSTVQRKTKQQT